MQADHSSWQHQLQAPRRHPWARAKSERSRHESGAPLGAMNVQTNRTSGHLH